MNCLTYDRLENDLASIREQRTQLSMTGKLTDQMLRQLAESEEQAVIRLTDHRAEHKCKKPGE